MTVLQRSPTASTTPVAGGIDALNLKTDYLAAGDAVRTQLVITNITNATQAVVTTATPHGLTNGKKVLIYSVFGMTEINTWFYRKTSNPAYTVTVVNSTSFKINKNTTTFGVYTSGGIADAGFLGTDDTNAFVNWFNAQVSLGKPGYIPPGKYICNNNLIHLLQCSGLHIFGHRHHSIIIDKGASKGKKMWWFGDDNNTTNCITMPPDSGISITSAIRKGTTLQVDVNTITNAATGLPLQVGQTIAFLDGTQQITYRSGTPLLITNISQEENATVTVAEDHGFIPGDSVPITGVVGMTQINADEYDVVEVISPRQFTLNVDSTGFSAYVSGGQAGNGGLAGNIGQVAVIAQINSPTRFTLEAVTVFDLNVGTKIGVWHAPVDSLTIENVTFQTDPVYHGWAAVTTTLQCDAIRNLNIHHVDFLDGTSRNLTIENCVGYTISDNYFHMVPGIDCNAMGIQQQSAHGIVSNNRLHNGLHLVQSGAKTLGMIGTMFFKAEGNHVFSNGTSAFDTHWNAYDFDVRNNTIVGINKWFNPDFLSDASLPDAPTRDEFSTGITFRGYGMMNASGNTIINRGSGIRYHFGGDVDGGTCTGNVIKNCKYGMYVDEFNKLKNHGNDFVDNTVYDNYYRHTSGQVQGYPKYTGMVFGGHNCQGSPTVPFLYFQCNQQVDADGFLISEDWAFSDVNAGFKQMVGAGEMQGTAINRLIPSPSTEIGKQIVGPSFALTDTTGAITATCNSAGVTSSYYPGEVVEPFGGTGKASHAITGITKANPAVVTAAAHGFGDGDVVFITGVVGMTQVNNLYFTVDVVDSSHFELRGIDSTAYGTYTSGGTCALTAVTKTALQVATVNIMAGVFTTKGTGFAPGNTFDLTGGTFNTRAAGVVDTVDGSGGILTFHFTNNGDYVDVPRIDIVDAFTIHTTSGSGVNAKLTATLIGPSTVNVVRNGRYVTTPGAGAAQFSTTDDGAGATYTITYGAGMLDLSISTKKNIRIDTVSAPIAYFGCGRDREFTIRCNTDVTFVNSANLVCPFGVNMNLKAGALFTVHSDRSEPPIWRVHAPQRDKAYLFLSDLTSFPIMPSAGIEQGWEGDGWEWRQRSDGRNFPMPKTDMIVRVAALESSTAFNPAGQITAVAGTITGDALASTTPFTRMVHNYNASISGTSQDSAYESAFNIYMDDARRVSLRWGLKQSLAHMTFFAGLKPTGVLGTTQPSTLANALGVGWNLDQANVHSYPGATDLGSDFPSLPTDATEYNVLNLAWDNNPSRVWLQLVRVKSDNTVKVYTALLSSSLPALGTALKLGLWGNTRSSSGVIQPAFMECAVESR